MNKKGFTLVELLAVIVILAVIALIAVPQVLHLIEIARIGSAEDSAYSYINSVENELVAGYIKGKFYEEGSYTIGQIGEKVKGNGPTLGSYTIDNNNKVVLGKFCINGYSIDYDGKYAVNNKNANYCKVAKEKYAIDLTGVNVLYKDSEGNDISQVLLEEDSSKEVNVKIDDNLYFEEVVCSDGCSIEGLSLGKDAPSFQTINIKQSTEKKGNCEIKTHIRIYTATYNHKTCTEPTYVSGSMDIQSCHDYTDGCSWHSYMNVQQCQYRCSCDGRLETHDAKETVNGCTCSSVRSYDCSYYSCPNGGTLKGTMCEY